MIHFSVASYNIHDCRGLDGRRDLHRVAAVIGELDVDLLALQELHTEFGVREDRRQLAALAELTGYYPIPGPTLIRADTPCGTAIFSRYPVQSIRHEDLSIVQREPRGALDVSVSLQGLRVRLIGTHLGLGMRERSHQIHRLLGMVDRADSDVLLLAGDINEWWPWSPALGQLHRYFGRQRGRATFPAALPLLALDRLWLRSPHPFTARLHRHWSRTAFWASDHLPIRAEITLAPAAVNATAPAADVGHPHRRGRAAGSAPVISPAPVEATHPAGGLTTDPLR